MAIQMRRGQKADFDPSKMLPGEWAVSIDNDTTRQKVWMCFAPGVVKEMGTYDDLLAIMEAHYAEIYADWMEGVICFAEETSTATQAYSVGDYVIVDEQMYKVTAAIAIGDTIEAGTNVVATLTGDELKALASSLAGKKSTQTAKTDPTADGNSLSFIDTITQNDNGEITATKKTVTTDATPTTGSTNPVQSGGVYSEIQTLNADLANKQSLLQVTQSISGGYLYNNYYSVS